jgi:hypothetical protein
MAACRDHQFVLDGLTALAAPRHGLQGCLLGRRSHETPEKDHVILGMDRKTDRRRPRLRSHPRLHLLHEFDIESTNPNTMPKTVKRPRRTSASEAGVEEVEDREARDHEAERRDET